MQWARITYIHARDNGEAKYSTPKKRSSTAGRCSGSTVPGGVDDSTLDRATTLPCHSQVWRTSRSRPRGSQLFRSDCRTGTVSMPAGMVTGCHRGEKNATMARLCHVGEATATSAGKLPRWRALPRWSSTKFEMLTQQPSNADDRRTRNSTPWRNFTPWTERRFGNELPINGTGSGSAGRPVPMELGAMDQHSGTELDDRIGADTGTEAANLMQSGVRGNKRLTPQELEQHLRQGLCFRCHKSGHLRRQCPLNESARS